ncbi:hypothetical protein QBC42DRAFT_168049 [Cladorrhinum samala]|uniref:Uncharacterized protein n=1 Tax=Cladorrhinum samala TaxID=585594 RepID=A0AAV9I0E2_9PEZI|nr:hypothetical protein QBC42DRAFT_168049 [Cladorrhinum samala]
MTKLVLPFAISLAAFALPTMGGSRAWESGLKHEQTPTHGASESITVDAAGFAIPNVADNGTEHLAKRYFAVKPGQGTTPTFLWPEKTLSFCFETQAGRDIMIRHLENAITAWVAAGLTSEVYRYREVAEPGESCTSYHERWKTLVIRHNDDGLHVTTVGLWPLDSTKPDYRGPTMDISTRSDVAHLNVLANFAHELGHAWGLYHEHQNPFFWSPPYYNLAMPGSGDYTPLGGKVFGDHFDCFALRDYHTAVTKVKNHPRFANDPAGMAKEIADLCVNAKVARDYGFSAGDWLPLLYQAAYSSPGVRHMNANSEQVDWDSIMIYASGSGGMGYARPAKSAEENSEDYDKRQPVLLRNDGLKIKSNSKPSKGDVAGIRKMYEDSSYAEGYGTIDNLKVPLLTDKKSTHWTEFMKNVALKTKKSCQNLVGS